MEPTTVDAPGSPLAWWIGDGRETAEPRDATFPRDVRQIVEQEIDAVAVSLARVAAVPGRIDAGRAAEGMDFEARVVGDGETTGQPGVRGRP